MAANLLYPPGSSLSPEVLTCRVETPITRYIPHRSVRAQFRHTALHDTYASDYPYRIILRFSQVLLSLFVLPLSVDNVSLLIWCRVAGYMLSVLDFPPVALPTFISTIRPSDYLYSIWFPFLIRTSYLLTQESIGSPQVTYRHCKTWLALRLRRSICFLTQTETYVLSSARKKTSTYGLRRFRSSITFSPIS